jgi:uncharacterized membrane protein
MLPLLVLVISWVLLRGVGKLGVKWLDSWKDAGRVALLVMFLFTASAHFTDTKHDLAAMVPDPFPRGMWLIYLTGVLEIAGAVGLQIPRLRRVAGICLILLLIGMFAANVNAAVNAIPLRGEDPTPLWLRTPIQLVFIGMIWWTSVRRPTGARREAVSGMPRPA